MSITGILALVDAVSAAESGLTITKISTNVVNGSGQVSGNVMTLNETGTLRRRVPIRSADKPARSR